MKRLSLFLLTGIFLLVGCEATSIKDGRKAYKKYFDKTLTDPKSLVIYEEKAYEWGDKEAIFELDYGAKNRLGGMVRKAIKLKTLGDNLLIIEDGDQKGVYDLKNQ